jgi:hypothetical protein
VQGQGQTPVLTKKKKGKKEKKKRKGRWSRMMDL